MVEILNSELARGSQLVSLNGFDNRGGSCCCLNSLPLHINKLLVGVYRIGLDPLLPAIIALENDGVFGILLHQAFGDHLIDDGGGLFSLLARRLKTPDLRSESNNLRSIDLRLHLLRLLFLLVLLDLLLASFSLRIGLHQVGTAAFLHCRNKREVREYVSIKSTYS